MENDDLPKLVEEEEVFKLNDIKEKEEKKEPKDVNNDNNLLKKDQTKVENNDTDDAPPLVEEDDFYMNLQLKDNKIPNEETKKVDTLKTSFDSLSIKDQNFEQKSPTISLKDEEKTPSNPKPEEKKSEEIPFLSNEDDVPPLVEEEDHLKSLEKKNENSIPKEKVPEKFIFSQPTQKVPEKFIPPTISQTSIFEIKQDPIDKELPPLITSDEEAVGEFNNEKNEIPPLVEDDLPPLVQDDSEIKDEKKNEKKDDEPPPLEPDESDGPPPLNDSEEEEEIPRLVSESDDDLVDDESDIQKRVKNLNGEIKQVTVQRNYNGKLIPKSIQSFIDAWNVQSPLFYSSKYNIDYFQIIKEFTSTYQNAYPNLIFFGKGSKEIAADLNDNNDDFTIYIIFKEMRGSTSVYKSHPIKLSIFLKDVEIVEEDNSDEDEDEDEEEEHDCGNPFCRFHRRFDSSDEEVEEEEEESDEESGCDDPDCEQHGNRNRREEPIYPVKYSDTISENEKKRTREIIKEVNNKIEFKEPENKKRKFQDKNVYTFLLLCKYCKDKSE